MTEKVLIFPQRIDAGLNRLQKMILFGIALTLAHPWFMTIGFVPTVLPVIVEARGIVLKLPDYGLLLLSVVTVLRLLFAPAYVQALAHTGVRLFRARLILPWVALALWAAVSLLWADEPVLTIYHAAHLALALLAALVVAENTHHASDNGLLSSLVIGFVVGGAAQGLLACLQALNGGAVGLHWLGELRYQHPRAYGLTIHHNTLSSYLVMAWFMTILWLRLDKRTGRWTILKCTALALIGLGLFAALSRMALLATALGTGGVVLMLPQSRQFYRQRTVQRIALAIALILLVIFGDDLLRRFPSFQELVQRLTFASSGAVRVIEDAPLIGVGAGNLMLHVDALASSGQVFILDNATDGWLQPVHNTYLVVLAELGPPGLLLFGLSLGAVFLRLSPRFGQPALILGWGVVALCVIMLTEFHFWVAVNWRAGLLLMVGLWWGYFLRGTQEAVHFAATHK
ncbi:MAG: O-antigen ligase family protein [bacterium]|nr:O-antigen ligase family protein [bacterium]